MTVLRVEGAEPPTPAEPQEPRGPRFPWNTAELRRKVLVGLVAAWAAAITGVVLLRDGEPAAAPSAARPSAAPSASEQPLTTGEVYQALLPSVVLIQTEGGGSGAVGRDAPSTGKAATGTGVVANADGTVLTALSRPPGSRPPTPSRTSPRSPRPSCPRRWCPRCSAAAYGSATRWWPSAIRSG
jgi:hypothetical protein